MIRLEHVEKTYAGGRVKAVDGLSMEVENGKVFGFIGPNGAGKTTTIKLLTGILKPDKGGLWLEGISMLERPVEAKRLIGYVPDVFEMYDRLTGLDYLRFLTDVYGVGKEDCGRHLECFLPLFEMENAIHQQIRSYSHGMKQKLSVIGSLLHRPAIWILDEPMTGLDPKSARSLKEEMRRHSRQGGIVFFSTHVLDVAEKLCDEIGIIRQGRLVAKGPLENLLNENRGSTLEDFFLNLTEREE